jgi:hypothetical protein
MTIRQQCEKDFTFNPEAPLPYNMLVGVFGFLAWNNADRSNYAEMRSILQEMIDAINETEESEYA